MDYKNGKIYTIRSYQTDDIYVGSTLQTLTKRLSKHKASFKMWKNDTHHYTSSYDIIKYGDAYIELIELFPCNSKMELGRREGELIRSMDCVNKRIEGRTKQEWVDENKDKIKIQQHNWYNKKREYYIARQKENDKNNPHIKQLYRSKMMVCECGSRIKVRCKAQHYRTKKHQAYVCLNE